MAKNRMFITRGLVVAMVSLFIATTAFCQSQKQQEEFTTLTVGVVPLVEHIPLVIAQKDMNATSKVKVRMDVYTSWTGLEAAFRTGAIDMAAVTLPKALIMAYEGVPLKILLVVNRNGNAVVFKAGDSIENIKGKIFGGSGSDTMDLVIFARFLKDKKLRLGYEARSMLIPLSKAISLIKEERLYGFCLPEPYGALAEKEGVVKKVVLSKDIYPNHINSVLIVNPNVLKNQPEIIKTYVKSIIKAAAYVEKDKSDSKGKQSAMVQVDILKMNPDVVSKALTTPNDRVRFQNLIPLSKEREEDMQDMMSLGMIGGKVNLKDLIDSRYSE